MSALESKSEPSIIYAAPSSVLSFDELSSVYRKLSFLRLRVLLIKYFQSVHGMSTRRLAKIGESQTEKWAGSSSEN